MSDHVVFRPQAESEILEARRWYEACRPGLGSEFAAAVESAVAAILEHPSAHRRVHGEIRRAVLQRFPYAVFFRTLPGEVVIVGIVHGHRDPQVWQSRR